MLEEIDIKSFVTRDEQEVAGHVDLMELLFSTWKHIAYSENHITQLHRDLLAHSSKDIRHRGQYKTHKTAWLHLMLMEKK